MFLKTAFLCAILTICNFVSAVEKIPASFYVNCSNLQVRFDKRKAYNMNSIIYKGKVLGIDKGGAHYGTVIKFPGVGFIGTGHSDIEAEKIVSLYAFADGKVVNLKLLKENAIIKAEKSFKLIRKSKIRNIHITNTIQIVDDTIEENVKMHADTNVELELIYNFMYPWTIEMTDYCAMLKNDKTVQGKSSRKHKFKIMKEALWVAVYSSKLQAGAVSKLIKVDKKTKNQSRLWDRTQYLKYYLMSYNKQVLPADSNIEFQMKTSFFLAPEDTWKKKIMKLAE